MRTLAVDFGTKRVGLAMSDAGGRWSEPFEVYPNAPDVVSKIAALCAKEGVQRLVVGLPLNMDDSPSWMTHASHEFGGRLAAATALPLLYVDERLSSFEAEQSLIDRKRGGEKLTRKDKKSMLDALAAAHLLREFIEGRLSPIEPPPLPTTRRR